MVGLTKKIELMTKSSVLSIILNYLKLVYIYNFTILIKPMENLETAKVPKDKFILLIDNRQDQRLIKINDNK